MVFDLSALNIVYNFMRTCPKQGMFFKSFLKKSFLKKYSIVIANKTLQNYVKQGCVYFLLLS